MKCPKCGYENEKGARFCTGCGGSLTGGYTFPRIQLRCTACNGVMEVEDSGNFQQLVCPFCGAKEMIPDSPEVTVEKIKSSTYKEVEFAKMQNEKEKEEKQELKERRTQYQKGKFSKVTLAFVFICLLAVILSFSNHHILRAFIAILQTGLFGASWLMGMQIIPEKKPFLHKLLAIAGFLLIILFFTASGGKGFEKKEKLKWPSSGLSQDLPEPKAKNGRIIIDSGDSFMAYIEDYSMEAFREYVDACQKAGFTLESEDDNDSYEAFNEAGRKLRLIFYSYSNEMSIDLDEAKKLGDLRWPNGELGTKIPVPDSKVGKTEWENSSGFVIYVGGYTLEKFNAYIEDCITAGFTVDYQRGDTTYFADNEEGYQLDLEYEGNGIIFIRLDAPEEEPSSEADPESSPEPSEEVIESGDNSESSQEESGEESVEESEETSSVEESSSGESSTQESSNTSAQSFDISSGLDNIFDLANNGEEALSDKLKNKLGSLYSMLMNLISKTTYEDIYNDYSAQLKTKGATLLEEYQKEAPDHYGDIPAQAEIANAKVEILASLANEGVEKMATLYYKQLDYTEYNDWATKLYDVYMEEANVIYNEYLNTAH